MDSKEKSTEKMCSFYVSDFHLEMILLPYINKKIERKEDIIISTEKDLDDTMKALIEKINLKEENKKEILKLGWKSQEKELKDNSNIIIIGTENYIDKINKKIIDNNINNVNIIDCYDFNDIKNNINDISNRYNKNLNTMGYNKL